MKHLMDYFCWNCFKNWIYQRRKKQKHDEVATFLRRVANKLDDNEGS